MLRLVTNGRFLSRPATGVDRVAEEVLRAWSRALGADPSLRSRLSVEVVVPPDARRELALPHIAERRFGSRTGHLWEQAELPRACRGAFLFNPCNTGPLAVSRSLTILHDAQVWQTPDAYGRAFRGWYRVLLPMLGRRSRLVSTVSDFSRAELERFGVVPKGKTLVAPNGCDHVDRIVADPALLERSDLRPGGYFFAIGSLSPHKNIRVLAEADALRRDASLPIVLAGGGDARVFSGRGTGASGIRHHGRVTDAELKALYEGAAALLFPSTFEGFGLPPLEAMRCGCPVIASTTPAVAEVCGEAALFAAPEDPAAWAARMDELAGDPALRARLSALGRDRSAEYSWTRTGARLLGAILSAEGGGGPMRSGDLSA